MDEHNSQAFDMHHTDPSKKTINLADCHSEARFRNEELRNGEGGLVVLCHSCHMEATFGDCGKKCAKKIVSRPNIGRVGRG